MALPTTRSTFKEYCLRTLGKPVVEINVDDDQVEDRIDEALSSFIDQCLINKYSFWYFNIIGKALARNLSRETAVSYVECHHYVPKALGGSDIQTVYLTAKEHFVCHILLTKMLTGNSKTKMVWAVMCLKGKNNRYVNSYLYEKVKSGLSHTVQAKIKMSQTRVERGTFRGERNPMFGKRGIESPIYGRKQSDEHRLKRVSSIKGRKHTDDAKIKMSLNRPKGKSNKRWFNNGIIETYGLPETKPADFIFGRLRRAS